MKGDVGGGFSSYFEDGIRVDDGGILLDRGWKQVGRAILLEPFVLFDVFNCGTFHGVSLQHVAEQADYGFV